MEEDQETKSTLHVTEIQDQRTQRRETIDLSNDLLYFIERFTSEKEMPEVRLTKKEISDSSFKPIDVNSDDKIVIRVARNTDTDDWRKLSVLVRKGESPPKPPLPEVVAIET